MKNKTVTLSVPPIYKDLFNSEKFYNLIYGGRGSGKSYQVALLLITKLLKYGKSKCLVLRQKQETHRYSTLAQIIELLDINNIAYEYNKNNFEVKLFNGSTFIFKGLDNPSKLKSIASIDLAWYEEATEINKSSFDTVNLSIRGVLAPNQIFLTFNPTNTQSWIYRTFFENQTPALLNSTFYLKTNYKDNPFCNETTINLLNSFEITDYQRYLSDGLGEWVAEGDLIFTFNNRFNSTLSNHLEITNTWFGLDYGFNNPSALIRVDETKEKNLYISEVFYKPKLQFDDILKYIQDANISTLSKIYVDSQASNLISYLRGFHYNVQRANKNVTDGISFLNQLRHLIYIDDNATNLLRELNTYQWKKDRQGNSTNEVLKVNDHSIDALRYAIFTHKKTNNFDYKFIKF